MTKVLIATAKPFADETKQEMLKILKSNNIKVNFLENYDSKKDLIVALKDADGVIIRSDKIDQEVIDSVPDLKIVVRAGSGFDTIDTAYAESKGIVVETTPGQNSNSVAEEVIFMMGVLARNLHVGDHTMKAGEFLASKLKGHELKGKKLGILGFGNIGKLVSKKAVGHEMEVYAYDPILKDPEVANEYGATLAAKPEELFENADFISLHIPENEKTKGLINYALLSLMSENGILINTARPGIINYEDLSRILKQRKGFKYGTDVNPPTFVDDNNLKGEESKLLLIPKLGAQTDEANFNAGTAAAEQTSIYFNEGKIIYAVNNPLPSGMKKYATLAQFLGKLNKAFIEVPHKIELVSYGELSNFKEHFIQYVLKGLFEFEMGKNITPAKALRSAKDMGIEISSRNPDPREIHVHSMDVIYHTEKGEQHMISGRIDEEELQVTRIGEFKQIIPITQHECVIVQYKEKAGMADKIGQKLTNNGYNKVFGGFGPNQEGKKAMVFFSVASNGNVKNPVKVVIDKEISKIEGVYSAINIDMR